MKEIGYSPFVIDRAPQRDKEGHFAKGHKNLNPHWYKGMKSLNPKGGPEGNKNAQGCHVSRNAGDKNGMFGRFGENHPMWKGGRSIRDGYVFIYVKGRGYVPEHRLVWEKAYGPIPRGQLIHHLNGIHNDNRLENLIALTRKEHPINVGPYVKRIQELEKKLADHNFFRHTV